MPQSAQTPKDDFSDIDLPVDADEIVQELSSELAMMRVELAKRTSALRSAMRLVKDQRDTITRLSELIPRDTEEGDGDSDGKAQD